MIAPLRTLLYPLTLPCGALFLLTALLARQLDPTGLEPAHTALALATVAGLGAVLAWRFQRSRLVLGLALICAAEFGLRRASGSTAAPLVEATVAVLLPLNLALVNLLPERGLLTAGGLGRVLLPAAQVAAAAWLHFHDPDLIRRWVIDIRVELPVLEAARQSLAGLTAFAAAAAVLAARYLCRPSALDAGSIWALVACLAGLAQHHPATRSGYFTGAAVILIAGLIEAFHCLAFRDELTGLPARRAFNETLSRAGGSYTLAMVDVDHFKKVNDRHGHDVGDQVLKLIASRLARITGGGRAFRYGGEEFTVLFPRTGLEQATPHLEVLRQRIAHTPFRLRRFLRPLGKSRGRGAGGAGSQPLRVTVSIGAAEKGARHPTSEEVLKAADKALYLAKRNGRNQLRS